MGNIFAHWKILALGIAILFAAVPATAANEILQAQPQITLHSIQIQLGIDGSSDVLEKYYLKFPSGDELQKFTIDAEKNGPSLQTWTIYDNRFFPHFGKQEDISNARISFDKKEGALRLEYHLEKGIMDNAGETSRQTSWELGKAAFNTYVKSGIVILPASTEITITLPQGATMEGSVAPEAKVTDSKVTWKGYLTTNYMKLSYVTSKPIAQPLDIGGFVQGALNSRQNVLILIIAALLLVLVYWKRNEIENGIENYIVEHSSLEHKERAEEEIEIDPEKEK